MGTAAFAVPALEVLFEEGYQIVGVVTQPDKPGGRGQTLQPPPVKRKALDLQLKVHQPATLKDDQARAVFTALAPDLIVLVAYGKLLPSWLIQLPSYGVINLHGSLLPRYRGAAPIQWAIANGERETGVCSMQIDEGLDTGPVFLCEKTPIGPDEGLIELSNRLAAMGGALMKRTIDGIIAGSLTPTPQDHAKASHAPPLRKADGYIDWMAPAQSIHNRIRAFNPWPGAVTRFRDIVCKILKSRVGGKASTVADPGTIVANKHSLAVACGDGILLDIVELQAPNRKPLRGADFANGMRIAAGEKFQRIVDN